MNKPHLDVRESFLGEEKPHLRAEGTGRASQVKVLDQGWDEGARDIAAACALNSPRFWNTCPAQDVVHSRCSVKPWGPCRVFYSGLCCTTSGSSFYHSLALCARGSHSLQCRCCLWSWAMWCYFLGIQMSLSVLFDAACHLVPPCLVSLFSGVFSVHTLCSCKASSSLFPLFLF